MPPFTGKPTVSQIRAHRRSIKHNVRGIAGLAVQVDGAEETQRALALLPAAVQRKVLRQALAAAARPVTSAMRKGAREYGKGSQILRITRTNKLTTRGREHADSVGATARSITQKVSTSKKDKSIAYAVVGAARGYVETVTINKSGAVQSLRARRRGAKIRDGVYKVRSRSLKNIGPAARKARLNPQNGLIQRRRPSRYLHLIETGGKKRHIRAGHFMDRAALTSASQSTAKFAEIFKSGMHREFQKMAAK